MTTNVSYSGHVFRALPLAAPERDADASASAPVPAARPDAITSLVASLRPRQDTHRECTALRCPCNK